MMRKFLRERELMRTVFPEGMEEFQQLLYCEGKQKRTLIEASVRTQLFCNMVGSKTGSPANANLSKTETQVPLPPIKSDALEGPDLRRLQKTYETMYAAGRILQVSNFCDKLSIFYTRIADTPASGPWLDHGQPCFEHGCSWMATMVNHGSFVHGVTMV